MSNPRREYDPQDQILWVHWPALQGRARVTREQLQPFIDLLIDKNHPDGPLRAIRFLFQDREAAAYNHDSLKFARIETFIEEAGRRIPLQPGSSPSFSVREDFGI